MPSLPDAKQEIFELICDGARTHAEESDEPDHEVGDLRDALFQAIKFIPAEKLRVFHAAVEDITCWAEEAAKE
jgi:hypothetical protein